MVHGPIYIAFIVSKWKPRAFHNLYFTTELH